MLYSRTSSPNQLWALEKNGLRVLPVYHPGYAFGAWTCQLDTRQYENVHIGHYAFYILL